MSGAALAAALAAGAAAQGLPTPPTGYAAVEEPVKPPVVALYSRPVWEGEVLLGLERHEKVDGAPSLEAFARQLGAPWGPVKRRRGGRSFQVYEDIVIESFVRPLPAEDPHASVLGSDIAPARLSLFERRRFPPGGDAYRLQRCRERGAWSVLKGYRRALARGAAAEEVRAVLDGASSDLLAACLGKRALAAMRAGEPVKDIPKPSMYRLRIMARDEWAHGAERLLERESVHLRDAPDAIWAVRYRAPERVYRRHREDFLDFAAGLQLP